MFKRHNGRRSETDLRLRRSLETTRNAAYARSSEQIARRPSSPHQEIPQIITTHQESHVAAKPNPRFSLMRFRHASDSAIGQKARDPNPPPIPASDALTLTPSIITTAPTNDFQPPKRTGTMRLWRPKTLESKPSTSPSILSSEGTSQRSSFSRAGRREGSTSRTNSSMRMSRVTFDEPERPRTNPVGSSLHEPPAYDDQMSSLPIPPPRLSESSRSTASSTDHYITTTTTQTTTTTTTFFRLPRRKKKETFLFPLPLKVEHGGQPRPSVSDTDLTPVGRPMSMMSGSPSPSKQRDHQFASQMLAASGLGFAGPGGPGVPILRTNSTNSTRSAQSSPTSLTPTRITRRDRSSTLSSLDRPDGRGSIGRRSFSSMFGRIRRDSEPVFGNSISRNASPQPYNSGSTSLIVSKETVTIPERNDEDTPQMYLSKLFQALSKSVVASLLARNGDVFHLAVLKSYMGTFDFASTPMDMALRKLLMEVELPSETQQIDRVLQAFADRYHECNPFIYQDSDQAYYVAFSLIMLHTDFFNKNNKHKMQKLDYVKNTSRAISNEGISNDILECFYHNITYTPFIRMEDEFDINGEKIVPHRPKRGLFNRASQDGKRIKEPVDPYTLIIDNQLDLLRPSLKDVVQIEDPYSYTGTASRLEMGSLHRAFFRSGVLQIMSARSRPDAFLSPSTMENPEGADPGVVEIKVTKVGVLWRKEMKKKKTRSPWHEWGVVLTGSQLYFFRNVSWVKNLIQQYEQHHKHNPGTPVIFKPPLEQFKPDAQISTDDAVALLDKTYKKHKNAFAFVRHGGMQEYFIADSETEMNDWLAKLNYAATFRTAGIRMRGVIGGNYEGQRTRAIRRADGVPDTPASSHFVQTPSGEVSILRGGIDTKLAAEISAARREVIEHKITDSEEKLATANRQLQTLLRNARHLSILTPIQPKTREQAVMAAGALAAKLQWVRMEMWKLRCHRDILALDMDEERKSMKDQKRRNLEIVTPNISTQNSPTGSVHGTTPPKSAGSGAPTPTQAMFSPKASASIGEDISHVVSNSSSNKNGSTWEFPQRTFDQSARASFSSTVPRSPSVTSLGNQKTDLTNPGNDHASIDTGHSYRSPSVSSFGGEPEKEKDEEKDDKRKEKDKGKGKDKESTRPKIRRSLQRTLRETQGLGHRRGKSKDVSSEDGAQSGEKYAGDMEGLARGSGSFTVHGKKASVITFGSEWQNMTAEDRLRRNKSTASGTGIESDSVAVADTESMASLPHVSSRRSSQQVYPTAYFRKDEDELALPQLPATLPASRRGSHNGHMLAPPRKDEELPEMPENLNVPGAKERLVAALNGVKAGERTSVVSESNGLSIE